MPTTPTLADAVAALKTYAAALTGRPGIEVLACRIGEPAPAALLAPYRANPHQLPPALLDLYELMNGAQVAWRFSGGDNRDGQLYIPELQPDVQMDDTEGETTFFGPGSLAYFFDEQQPEYGTALVAYGPDGPSILSPDDAYDYYGSGDEDADDGPDPAEADVSHPYLVFAYHADADPGVLLPYTIAEYIRQAIAHDLVLGWPGQEAGEGEEEGADEEDDENE